MRWHCLVSVILAVLLPAINSPASDSVVVGKIPITISGSLGFDMGQIVKGRYEDQTFDHVWFSNSIGNITIEAVTGKYLTIMLGIEGRMWFNSFPPSTIVDFNAGNDQYYSFYLNQAQLFFSLLKGEALSIDLGIGILPYKYNPEVTNLGEYLFRSGTYPAYLINTFDFPQATLSGMRIGLNYGIGPVGIKFDQLVLTESEVRPFHDLTLASVVDINAFKLLDIGGGVSFARIIPVDNRITTPENRSNSYYSPQDTAFLDPHYYTFAGTKLMARATFDPLFFVRESRIGELLGKGGKIYGEIAILGIKDYPKGLQNQFGYDTLSQKMPMMFGITVPVPKALDVCAVEFEYYSCPYPDDYSQVFQHGWPLPRSVAPGSQYDAFTYAHDSWKWSVYAKKHITPHFALVGQVGRDHERWAVHISHLRNYDFEDATVKNGEWLWHFKIEGDY
jgi:hypothetical protein